MACSLWRRHVATLVAAALLTPSVLGTTHAMAQPAPNPKVSLADAERAARAKDWPTAARLYGAAYTASPSAEALEGLANAYYQSGQLGEAFATYTEWTEKYAAKAPAPKKRSAEARLKELDAKTGSVTIRVNEPGATLTIDDKPAGTSPLSSPVRLAVGARRVRATKDGFSPAEQTANVTAGGATTVQVSLTPSATKGKLVVREKSGKPIRVTVDGVDVGEAPWSGEVDPGPHDVGARGVGVAASPRKVTVERGKTEELELVAVASTAPVKIGTSDAKGLIYLDGKLVGEGAFVGDISSGPHALKITREGYDPFEEEITIREREPFARTVTLKLVSKIETGPLVEVERLEGLYGGFGLMGFATPGGTGSSMERQCDAKSQLPPLLSCETPDGVGGGLGGFFGYHWDPVGLELYLAGHYDQRTYRNDWNAASTDPGIGPDPARLEEFNLRRAGGMGLARVRATWQSKHLRLSLAAGAGVSYRVMSLDRDTRAKDASGARDVFVSDTPSYVSPVVALEPTILYRLTRGVAVSLGVQLFLETPGSFLNGGENPKTAGERNHALGLRGLTTPSYELASNVQIFVGPVLGMMFGP